MGAESRSLLEKWLEADDAGDVDASRLDQVVLAHVRDGKAAEMWEVADVGVLLRRGV
jgi:hypothetical protein